MAMNRSLVSEEAWEILRLNSVMCMGVDASMPSLFPQLVSVVLPTGFIGMFMRVWAVVHK